MEKVDRLERLTDLVQLLLDAPRPLSLREIGDAVPGYPPPGEARRQAFERDKRTLRNEGIALLTEQVGGPEQIGYRIRGEDYFLPELGLTTDEQAALDVAVAEVHLGDPTGRQALWRLGLPAAEVRRPMIDLPSLPALPVLFDAVRARAAVSFDYRGEARRVAPAALRFRNGWWYLVSHDLVREAARTFRVDRIDGLPTAGPAGGSGLPEGFDADAAFSEDPLLSGEGEPVTVSVVVDPLLARWAVHEVGERAVAERRDDGAVVLRLEVSNVPALRSWVLGMGEHAVVLHPPEIRAAVTEWLTATATAVATAPPTPAAPDPARDGKAGR